MNFRRAISLACTVLIMAALVGCGTLNVQVEMPPQATRTRVVISTPIMEPSPTAATASVTPTLESAGSATGQTIISGTPLNLVQIKMLDKTKGWGIGEIENDLNSHILVTSDGGNTWLDRTPIKAISSAQPDGWTAVAYFRSNQQAWVTFSPRRPQGTPGQLIVWYTTDGGITWGKSQVLDLSDIQAEFELPSDLGFLDSQQGWIMVHLGVGMSHDYVAVFITGDGGKTWTRVLGANKNPELMGCQKTGLAFTTGTTGWITGNCPGLMPSLFFYRTVNSGTSWDAVDLPVPQGKTFDYFSRSEIGCGIPSLNYATARNLMLTLSCTNYNNNTNQSWLYASTDGGLTWSDYLLPTVFGYIGMIDSLHGFFVGSTQRDTVAGGEIYNTTDGGNTWLPIIPTNWGGAPDFVDGDNGWVIAVHDKTQALVNSTNGGKFWVELKPVIK
jgi:photosystem II stability/assembly factor-like uncharacterized protein